MSAEREQPRSFGVVYHRAPPESYATEPSTGRWDWNARYDPANCGGRLQAAYVRAGSASKWTRVGSICVRCGTYWRDSRALETIEPQRRLSEPSTADRGRNRLRPDDVAAPSTAGPAEPSTAEDPEPSTAEAIAPTVDGDELLAVDSVVDDDAVDGRQEAGASATPSTARGSRRRRQPTPASTVDTEDRDRLRAAEDLGRLARQVSS